MGYRYTEEEIAVIRKGLLEGKTCAEIHKHELISWRPRGSVENILTRIRKEMKIGFRTRGKLLNHARTYVKDEDDRLIESLCDLHGVPRQRVIRAAIKLGLSQVEKHHLIPGGLADE